MKKQWIALMVLLLVAITLSGQAGGYIASSPGIPMESSLGSKGSQVRSLQLALSELGFWETEADGVYTKALMDAVLRFQESRGLLPTGRADVDTLRLLFLRQAKEDETQLLLWYGQARAAIPWGSVFEIKDIGTGIVFQVYVVMGKDHLDAEPLSPQDTALMKEAYGGRWSWARRPILLRYRGQVYAASMNGMPHGMDTSRGNRMDGHFCVHFLEGRGYDSPKVDAEHQMAAFEAAAYQWDEVPSPAN